MKWSFSQYSTFQRCQRQWYYRNIYASAIATKDQGRLEAYRLSKLVNLKAWRGKIVDDVISSVVVPAIDRGWSVDIQTARKAAWNRFIQQKQAGTQLGSVSSDHFGGFLEVEYGSPPTQSAFDDAWSEVDAAMHGFFACSFVWDALRTASTRRTQRRIPFSCDAASLIAVPDVICFYAGDVPLIIDWKVQSNPVSDYWMQLATYALALTRCTPHRDWPSLPPGLSPIDVKLAEIQLLTGTVRRHTVTQEDVEEIEEIIACSTAEMSLARQGRNPKDLRAEDFPTARSPGTCYYCSFRKLCWVTQS